MTLSVTWSIERALPLWSARFRAGSAVAISTQKIRAAAPDLLRYGVG
ncbi:MAG: hypothetical protein GX086_13300 [Alcaligenaceae bacterium]|nr:hypothetical protein [Alcaligenaceae bacterium]